MRSGQNTNVFAIISLIVGVLSIPLAFICCIGFFTATAGLALGIVGLLKANRGELGGRKLAIAGIVANVLAPLIYVIVFVVIFALAATNDQQSPSLFDTDPLEQLDD